jgi:hypothetical protein
MPNDIIFEGRVIEQIHRNVVPALNKQVDEHSHLAVMTTLAFILRTELGLERAREVLESLECGGFSKTPT